MPERRPRKRLPAQIRRDAIARAALPLFARNGLHGVTTRELAAACGVSEALMFRHFPTKQALFNEMMHQYKDRVLPESEQVNRLPPPSTSTLVELVFMFFRRVIVREATAGHDMMRFFYRSFTEDGQFSKQFLESVKDLRVCFEKNLIAAQTSGDALVLKTAPYNFFWFTQHVATAACMIRLPARPAVRYRGSLEKVIEEMVVFVLRGAGLTEEALTRHATPEAFDRWRRQTK